MDQDQLIEYLKKNLSIKLDVKMEYGSDRIVAKLMLEDEEISSDSITISQDTARNY